MISTKKEKSFVHVQIADNGKGIPDEDKPHIFEMFYTANNEITDSKRSLGLGLALCKSITKTSHTQNGLRTLKIQYFS